MIGSVAVTNNEFRNITIRRALMLGASTLAFGLSSGALAQTTAVGGAPANSQGAAKTVSQDLPPQTGQTVEEAETEDQPIVVTGVRAALQSAQAVKQNAEQFVDSISAIDIGKLPDRNVAEALQRVSGVQITRNRGEGSGIAIRGLTQVRTEVNGRDSFGASGGRSLGFEDVPSELLAAVDVYKNPSAELIEGGIGGTINLRTRMPFDQKGLVVAATIGANHYDLADDTRFNGSVLVSDRWETGIGEIGVLLDVSYFGGTYRSDEIVIEPYVDTVIGGQTRSVPDGAGIGTYYGERQRKGYYAAVQWAPSNDLEFYGQFFRSDYYISSPNTTSFVTRGEDPIGVEGLNPLPGFAFDNDGVFQAGGFSGFASDYSLAPSWNNRNQLNVASNTQQAYNVSRTSDYALGFKWSATDRLRINADFQYVKADAENRSYTAFGQHNLASYNLDLRGDLPAIQFGAVEAIPGTGTDYLGIPPSTRPININDPSYYNLVALMDHKEDSDAEQKAARLDLEWDFDNGSFIRSISAGVRYTDRSAINRSTPYAWSGASVTTPLTDPRLLTTPYDSTQFFGGQNSGVGPLPFVGGAALLEPGVAGLFRSLVGRDLTDYTSQDVNTQGERTYGAYAMLRFGFDAGVPIDGNLGVRVVRTKNEAVGSTRLTYRVNPADPNAGTTTLDVPFAEEQDYTRVLPSLNLRAHLTDKLQARFAAAKSFARPAFYDLRAVRSFSVGYNEVLDSTGTRTGYVRNNTDTGSGGNPLLRPLLSSQLDASLEWYPKAATMLYGTVFYKELRNFPATIAAATPYAVPGLGDVNFNYSALINQDQGTAKGFEIGGNTFFDFLPGPLSGLGVQANLTFVDSNAPGAGGALQNGVSVPTPLIGLSKWSYNLVGLYEKYGVTLRAAYNWRDSYLVEVDGNGTGNVPLFHRPYGQLDASLSYDFSKTVSATIDVVNLLRNRKETYQAFTTNPREYQLDDRRIGFSLRIRN